MKTISKYLKDYKKEAVLAPLFKLLEALFDLFVPLVIARIINNGIPNNDTSYILQQFLILIALAVIGLTCSITAQYFSAKASIGYTTKLRQALFDHILHLSNHEIDGTETSTLITRLTSDCNQVQNGLNLTLRLLLRSPFIVFGAMIMAFTINVRIAMIFLVSILLLSLIVFGIMLVCIPLFKSVQKKLDRLLFMTRENLAGIRVIRAFRKEQEQIQQFQNKNREYTKRNEFTGMLNALMNPLTFLIINIAAVMLIQRGAVEISLGSIKQGDVVALYNYMAQIVIELIKMASLLITIDKSIACAKRIESVFEMNESMQYGSESYTDAPVAIEADHAAFAYYSSNVPAIEDISFSIQSGQTLGIIGGTGSGKSTIASLIARYYDTTEGSIKLFSKPIQEYSKEALTNIIGIVPQKASLFAGTIRENMQMGNENATDEEIWNALKIAQAEEIVSKKDGKLDYRIEQNGRNLSGGQKQRLTIARALVKNPQILILDDSASALDFATDAALRKAIAKLNMTVVIISQRTSAIRNADRILVIEDGKIAGDGTHNALMQSCRQYQETYYSQFPDEKPADFDMEVIA